MVKQNYVKKKISEFIKNVHKVICKQYEDSREQNRENFDINDGPDGFSDKFQFEQKHKEKIEKNLAEIYNNPCLKKIDKKVFDAFYNITSKFFLKTEYKYLENEFYNLELYQPITAEAKSKTLSNFLKGISFQKKFIDKAIKSSDSLKYAKLFSNSLSVEKALMVNELIKNRHNIKLVKRYEPSSIRDEILKVANNVLSKLEGSAEKLFKLTGKRPQIDLSKISPELELGCLAHEIRCNDYLKDLGFLCIRYGNQNIILDVFVVYKINNVIPIYIIKDPKKDFAGLFGGEYIFVVEHGRDDEKEIIQHELDHLILQYLGAKINEEGFEYSAYLSGIVFGGDCIKIWKKLIHRKSDLTSLHYKALMKLHILALLEKDERSNKVKLSSFEKLYNDFYKDVLGLSYTEIEKLCN